jgi:hypothetical protein
MVGCQPGGISARIPSPPSFTDVTVSILLQQY